MKTRRENRIRLACLLLAAVAVQAWVPTGTTSRTNAKHGWKTLLSSRTTTQLFHAAENHDGFNVVLAPSDSETAFDNFKVGNARVHRYRREQDGEVDGGATEYVMWYHGRSHQMNSDNPKLPPLSTGRIGRATSRNGLVFEKDTKGAVSEDAHDVSLGLNKESWWAFDTAHTGLGQVLLPMSTPAVISEGGVYLMYYMGGSGEETSIVDYMEDDVEIPDSMKDATLQGMNMKIGVALSQDGITWGRIEGDDPSGACMVPYRKSDPNLAADMLDSTDIPEELYCAWPEVAVDTNRKKKDEAFIMYYSTMTAKDKQKCIAYAVSGDGFRWVKKGVCIEPGSDDEFLDSKGCSRCSVFKDAVFDAATETWTELDNSWKMYYEGVSASDNKHRILMAESKDGCTWTKTGLALDVGEDDAWDCNGVSSPHCIRYVVVSVIANI